MTEAPDVSTLEGRIRQAYARLADAYIDLVHAKMGDEYAKAAEELGAAEMEARQTFQALILHVRVKRT